MKVTKEKTENSQAYLLVEMEPAEVEESLEKSYRQLVQRTRVPGFRLGKTPRVIFERYYTRQGLLDKAIEDLVPQAYEKAIKEQEIEPIARPQIEITQAEPLVFKAIVPLKPTVKLGDYNQLRLTAEPAKEVGDKDVDEVIEALRHQHATWEPVAREVQSGDLVTIDIWSEVDGKPYINQKGGQYQATAGSAFPMPGFAEKIIGMKPEEEKEFTLSFPADDPRTEYAGKEVKFKIRLNEIKEEKLSDLNDDFAKLVNAELTTIAALRERMTTNMKLRAEDDAKKAYEDKILDTAVSQSQIEFPEVLVDSEIHRMMDQQFQTRERLEAYLKSTNKTEEQLHEELHSEYHDLATTRVKRSLLLGKVAEEEKIKVEASEIDTEIEKMLKASEADRDRLKSALDTQEFRESISRTLLTNKTIERLKTIAGGTAETKSEKEESK
jgi:trigger factor